MATASENAELSHCYGLMDEADLDCGSVQFNLDPKAKGALNEAQDSEKTDASDTESKLDQLNASSNDNNSKEHVSLQDNTKNDTGTTSVKRSKCHAFFEKKAKEELKPVDSGCF